MSRKQQWFAGMMAGAMLLVLGSALAQPSIVPTAWTVTAESCAVFNQAIDPGEQVTMNICLTNIGTVATANLVATLQATGGVTNPSAPVTLGALAAGGGTACGDFTFTASGTCGTTITLTFQLQDGATNLGETAIPTYFGQRVVTFIENFDAAAPPVLPAGWTGTLATGLAGDRTWETTASAIGAPPNAAYCPQADHITDCWLDSPSIPVTSAFAILQFRTEFDLEDKDGHIGWDGAVLEISANGGPFVDILAAGGTFLIGGYNETIAPYFGNPLANRRAWSGNSGAPVDVLVSLPIATAGQSVKFRWRVATDDSQAGGGMWVDSVVIFDGFQCCSCELTCPADVTVSNDAGQCGAVVNYPAPTASAGCGLVTATPPSGTTFPVGQTTVDVASAFGSSCSFVVTVNDTEAPQITCPANISTSNDANQCGAVVNFVVTATDNCGVPAVTSDPPSGSLFPIGTTTVTSTATDAAGNQDTCTFTVTVNDTQPPTIACPADIVQSNDPGQCGAVVNFAPTVNDNCPNPTVVCTPASGSFFQLGTTTVNCTVTDASNNTASCSFNVTVNDTEAPVVTCPANVTQANDPGQCGAVVNFAAPTVTDNCPGATVVAVPPSGSTFPVGTSTVTCTATDGANNTASCTFTVTVNDTEGPVIVCPADITVGNDTDQCGAVVSYTATATDNCGTVVSVVGAPESGSFFALGTTTVEVTATDAANNQTSCTFTVTVNDTQQPTIACPADIVQSNDPGQCGAVVNFAPTVNDNCPNPTVVCTPASGSFFQLGTTTVNCTVTDAANNTASCSFNVTINDTEAPVVTCPANVTQANDPGQCGAVVNFAAPTVTDNCPGATVVAVPPSGSTFPVGTSTVTCTATDGANNTAACTFTVTVNDTEAPVIACPADITVGNDTDQCGAVVNYTATATDNCGTVVSIIGTPASGTFFAVGTTAVQVAATDAAGNQSSCSFNVTVNDTQQPTIECPVDVVVPNDAGQCGAVVNYPAPTVTGGCKVLTMTPPPGSFFPVGTTPVTCSVSGGTGATCTFNVTVLDMEAPQLTCPPNLTAIAGQTSGVVTFNCPTATDNCSSTTVVCNPPSGSVFPNGTTVVTVTATDESGNVSTCTFNVTVFDYCLQETRDYPNEVLFVNVGTGEYLYCNPAVTLSGQGTITRRGSCQIKLAHKAADRNLNATINTCTRRGSMTFRYYYQPRRSAIFRIEDGNMDNNTCQCQ